MTTQLATQTAAYEALSPVSVLLGLVNLLALYLLISWAMRGEPTPRATARQTSGAVDPVDVHAAQPIAICNGRPEFAAAKGDTSRDHRSVNRRGRHLAARRDRRHHRPVRPPQRRGRADA